MKINCRGQGLVETVLSLPLLILVVTAFAILLYRSLVFHIADYQAHEALICSQSESKEFCQQELENRLRKILLSGSTYRGHIKKSWSGFSVSIEIKLNQGPTFLNPPLEIQKSL